jgi:hypothetical protein
VSAERLEYHPHVGALNKTKTLQQRRDLVSAERLELSTNGLKGRCSTIELRAHL